MVRYHMAAPREYLITIFRIQILPYLPPVRFLSANAAHIRNHFLKNWVLYIRASAVQKYIYILLRKCHGLKGSKMAGRLKGNPIMADAGCLPHQADRQIRIIRTRHSNGVNKNLRPNLLRQCGSVRLKGSAFRRIHTIFQIQERRMFRRPSQPAPPQYRFVFYDIVKPCIAERLGGKFPVIPIVLQRPEKRECSRNIIIRYNQRYPCFFVDIVFDFIKCFPDFMIAPSLYRTPQVDANDFAQHSRVSDSYID